MNPKDGKKKPNEVKLIAHYLPQFHPFEENDKWWGKGFTEWRNVSKAKPHFKGHHQPHLPADLGYYDLRIPEVREAQAEMAKAYGIYGFCYYHYWFGGKKLMSLPFEQMLKSKKPDFPFCVCWANENWTKRWDGREEDVLIAQNHSDEDDRAFIKDLIPAFRDNRYIRVKDKPMLLLWRPKLLPDMKRTASIWREEAKKHGIDDLYLVAVESWHADVPPSEFGLDASTQFAPQTVFHYKHQIEMFNYQDVTMVNYMQTMEHLVNLPNPNYPYFRSAFPAWDNTPRREKGGFIFHGSSPLLYAYYLHKQIELTKKHNAPEEQYVFINAWNEWAEGAHLEPDMKHTYAYLQATLDALTGDVVSEIKKKSFSVTDFEPLFLIPEEAKREAAKLIELNLDLQRKNAELLDKLEDLYSARSWKMAQGIHKFAETYKIKQILKKFK